jgi:multidrug resistance efflux pump
MSQACAECAALLSAYDTASEDFTVAVGTLDKMQSEYQKFEAEVDQARSTCQMARTALRVHREGHYKAVIVPEDLKRSG